MSYAEQLAVRSGAAQRRQYYRLVSVGQTKARSNFQDGAWDEMSSTIDVTRARSTADFDQNYEPINDSYTLFKFLNCASGTANSWFSSVVPSISMPAALKT